MSVLAATSRAETGTADPVRAVSVVSTGSVEIHPEHAYGTRKPLYWWLLTSRSWLPARPINVYVIEHAERLVLFDTGQDRASVTDDSYFPGGLTGVIYDRPPGSTSTPGRHSRPSSARSGTRPARSAPRSCPTCTRTTSAASLN
jgi:hypothetical protein